jgi:sec-independent protein translocase protein TatA
MPLLGHLPELLVVLLIGLLVFGPKRMIEMGSSVGKAVREMRESLKDVPGLGGNGMQSLLGQQEPLRTPFVATSQTPPAPVVPPAAALTTDAAIQPPSAAPMTEPSMPSYSRADGASVVEGTVERVVETPEG